MGEPALAARFEELIRRLRGPTPRARRVAIAVAAAAAVLAAGALGIKLLSSRMWPRGFPRHPGDLAAGAQEARLSAVMERLDSDPENIQALVEAGTLHFLKGPDQYRAAINELEEAHRLGAVAPRLFYYLGVMYQEEGLLPFAIAEYRRFVRNFPEDKEVRLLLGKLLYQTGRYEDAAVQFQSLGRKRDPVVEENLGLCELALKRYDEAARSFTALLRQPVFEPRAHFYLGQAAFEVARYGDARAELAKAAAAAPAQLEGVEPTALWALVASNDEKLQDWTAAKEHWDKLLQIDPKSSKARTSLRRLAPRLRALKAAALRAAKPRPAPVSKRKSARRK